MKGSFRNSCVVVYRACNRILKDFITVVKKKPERLSSVALLLDPFGAEIGNTWWVMGGMYRTLDRDWTGLDLGLVN